MARNSFYSGDAGAEVTIDNSVAAAALSETNAAASASTASTQATNAASSATSAAASYDSFDDRYLGTKSSDPSVDNDGDALVDGALYFNTTNNVMMVYDLGNTTWNRTTPTSSDQTKINTVSGIQANVTTVAGISSNVTTVAGISSDVTAVAGDATDIGTVAAKATEIGRLGTADAVADMAILGTTDVVADMNTLATADVVADMNTLGTADVVADMNTLGTADVVADMNTLATSDIVADMNLLATSANVTAMGLLGNADTVADMGILGTADVVADLNTLATADVVADLNTLGTADVVSDLNTLGTADVVSDMNTLGTSSNVTNMNTLAGISSNVTTVAGISGNVTTVAGIASNVTSVAGNATNINAVAADASDIGAVAGKATEIGRLGTADAVADLAVLGTADVVSDLNTLGTADVVADMNTLGTADNVTNMNTVADNIAGVNSFAERYRVASSAPTGSLDEGDLYFNTTDNKLYHYNGSAWAEIKSYSVQDGELSQVSFTTADNTKLDGIEANATADQTNAEIKTAYEANSNTNEFSDAEQTKVSNLSGTNTGDQTITLTGDVTGSGTGSFAATIATDAVDIAMLSATGTASSSTFLRGDNSWVTPTDTNTTYTAGTGLTLAGTEFSAASLALTTVQTAANQTAHLALTAQEGDVVVRSDENKSYVHNGGTAGTMADYTLLLTPTDAVLSVDGNTGAVTLNHDTLTGFVANEHIDWTADQGGTNIHAGNYTDTVYTHPTSAGNKHIPSGGAAGQVLKYSSSGTAVWGTDDNDAVAMAIALG